MKEYVNYPLDDSWILTIEEKPEVNRDLQGIYFDWINKKGKYKQIVDIYDLIYIELPENSNYRTYSQSHMFYKNEQVKNFSGGINTNYTPMKNPYAWRYKD